MESDSKDLMTLEFRRSGDLSKPLRVYFKIGGSADWNTDFTVIPGGLKSEPVSDPNLAPWVQSVVIPAGSAAGKLPLAPIPDDKVEGDELLYLAVIPKPANLKDGPESSDYLPGTNPAARVMIRDSILPAPSDAPTIRILAVQSTTAEPNPFIRIIPGRLVFQRLGNPAEPVRVRYAVGGSARNGEDFPSSTATSLWEPVKPKSNSSLALSKTTSKNRRKPWSSNSSTTHPTGSIRPVLGPR